MECKSLPEHDHVSQVQHVNNYLACPVNCLCCTGVRCSWPPESASLRPSRSIQRYLSDDLVAELCHSPWWHPRLQWRGLRYDNSTTGTSLVTTSPRPPVSKWPFTKLCRPATFRERLIDLRLPSDYVGSLCLRIRQWDIYLMSHSAHDPGPSQRQMSLGWKG
jgi:hypothetical protein